MKSLFLCLLGPLVGLAALAQPSPPGTVTRLHPQFDQVVAAGAQPGGGGPTRKSGHWVPVYRGAGVAPQWLSGV